MKGACEGTGNSTSRKISLNVVLNLPTLLGLALFVRIFDPGLNELREVDCFSAPTYLFDVD